MAIKLLMILSITLYLSNMAHANDDDSIVEICEHQSHRISSWVSARADNESKSVQRQKMIDDFVDIANKSSFNKGAVHELQTAYFGVLDKIYQDKPMQLNNPKYIDYVEKLEEQAQSDCIRRLQVVNNQYKDQNRFKTVMVQAECGYGCFQKDFNVEKAQAPISVTIDNNFNNASYINGSDVAGSYRYNLYFRDSINICSGVFDVRNSDRQIILHINQRNCNVDNIYRYP